LAACTETAQISPRVSTRRCRLCPGIRFPASKPQHPAFLRHAYRLAVSVQLCGTCSRSAACTASSVPLPYCCQTADQGGRSCGSALHVQPFLP
jgi:hypothetical protein